MINRRSIHRLIQHHAAMEVIEVADMLPHLGSAKRILLSCQGQVLSVIWFAWRHGGRPAPIAGAWLYAWLASREDDEHEWFLEHYVLLKPHDWWLLTSR